MKNTMTYAELRDMINRMSPAKRQEPVTIYVSESGEYFPLVQDYPFINDIEQDETTGETQQPSYMVI